MTTHLRVLTQSEIRTHHRCARERSLRYVAGVRPAVEAEALSFGTAFHRGLEWLWGSTWSGSKPPEGTMPLISDPFKQVTLEVLLEGYRIRWEGSEYEPIAVEAEFRAPMINPETGAPSKTFELGGKLDALAKDRNGEVWIVEHKTTSEDVSLGSDYWKRLRIDTQVSTYYVGARALGHEPVGVLYDVVRKPTIRPGKNQTPEEWRAKLVADVCERPDFYFARGVVVRLEQEERDAAFDVWQTARAIAEADRLKRYPRNADACVRWGRTCDFFPVCVGEGSLEDETRYRKAERPHEELSK